MLPLGQLALIVLQVKDEWKMAEVAHHFVVLLLKADSSVHAKALGLNLRHLRLKALPPVSRLDRVRQFFFLKLLLERLQIYTKVNIFGRNAQVHPIQGVEDRLIKNIEAAADDISLLEACDVKSDSNPCRILRSIYFPFE